MQEERKKEAEESKRLDAEISEMEALIEERRKKIGKK